MNDITSFDVVTCQHRLMLLRTPNAFVTRVPRQKDPNTSLRKERFADFCRRRGWWDEGLRQWRASEIAEAIGKKANQVNNLLSANYSFGPTVAREIEDALELSPYYLEGAAAWPFSRALQKAVEGLDEQGVAYAENALRAHLRLPPVPIPSGETQPTADELIRNGAKAA